MPAIVLRRRDVVSLSQRYGDPIIGVPQSAFMIVVWLPTASLSGSRQTFQRILLASGVLALQRTALLARQPCVRQVFGNCPLRVDSRFCKAHPYTDKRPT
jgi:hypothetical protein